MEHLVAQAVTVKGYLCMYCSDPSYTAILKHFYEVSDWRAPGRTKQYIRRLPVFVQNIKIKIYFIVDDNHFES